MDLENLTCLYNCTFIVMFSTYPALYTMDIKCLLLLLLLLLLGILRSSYTFNVYHLICVMCVTMYE